MEENKIKCSQCGEIKPETEFYLRNHGTKRMSECKSCNKIRGIAYRSANKYKVLSAQAKFFESDEGKKWLIKYKESGKRSEAQHKYNTSEKGRSAGSKYNQTEKAKRAKLKYAKSEKGILALNNKLLRRKERYIKDPAYNLLLKMRRRLNHAIHDAETNKICGTIKLIGCTPNELKHHIESLFTDGMNWDFVLSGEIQIDHIIPCSSFDLTDVEQQKKCFHYTNLQPLWETTRIINGVEYIGNLNKGSKI